MSAIPAQNEKSAYQSLTLRSVAALAVAAAASRLGVELPLGVAQDLAGAVVDLVFTLGLIGAAIGRVRARGPIV
jgi:hypothetical protein